MKLTTPRLSALLASALGILSVIPSLQAQVFTFNNRDMMLCFRKTGADGGTVGANNFQVNIGQISNYYNLAAGSSITVTTFNAAQLAAVFDNLNDLNWSIAADVRQANDGGDQSIPVNTLWLTLPRIDPTAPRTPWLRKSSSTQSATESPINSISDDAVVYSSTIPSNPTNNSPTTISIPTGGTPGQGPGADAFLSANGTYGGKFQGDVENTTPATFVTSNLVSRSDLIELRPSSTANLLGKYLGYFELRASGTLVFVSAPGPTLTITQSGTTNKISFNSIATDLYTLYVTNAPGLLTPTSTWQTFGTQITGDGKTDTFTNVTTDPTRVYRIKVN